MSVSTETGIKFKSSGLIDISIVTDDDDNNDNDDVSDNIFVLGLAVPTTMCIGCSKAFTSLAVSLFVQGNFFQIQYTLFW